jgi:hypothetical protein
MKKPIISVVLLIYADYVSADAAPDNLQMSFNKDMHKFWRSRRRSTDTKKEEVQPKSVRKSAEKTISEVGHFVESAVREEVDALFGCKYHDHGGAPKESKAVPEPTKRTLLHFHRKVEPVSSKSIGGRRGASSSVKVNEHPEEIEHHLTFLDVMETYADNINRYGF